MMRTISKSESQAFERAAGSRTCDINLGTSERWISLAAGTALVAAGLARRSSGGLLMAMAGGFLIYRGQSGHCALRQMMEGDERLESPLEIRYRIVVACSADAAYNFCKDPQLAARVLGGGQRISSDGANWDWTWQGPGGIKMDCRVDLTEDHFSRVLSWRSLPESRIEATAEVQFLEAPADRGTEIRLRLSIVPRVGLVGETVGILLRPFISALCRRCLRRLKGILESGESVGDAQRMENTHSRSQAGQQPRASSTPWSEVDEASMESFPASDAPAWSSAERGIPRHVPESFEGADET